MDKGKVNLVFKGETKQGTNLEDVKQNLAALFKKDAASIDRMFDGKPRTIKQNIDLDTYDKIARMLDKAGAKCSAVKVITNAETSEKPKPETPSTPPPPDQEKRTINNEQSGNIRYFRAWLFWSLLTAVVGCSVSFIAGALIGVLTVFSGTQDQASLIASVIGFVIVIPISFVCFKWSVKKYIVPQIA